jgi:hypothetical protein
MSFACSISISARQDTTNHSLDVRMSVLTSDLKIREDRLKR